MKPLEFQQAAIEELLEKFKILWATRNKKLDLVFKSPTGSGKTFMVTSFINELNNQPDWDFDKAFVWITFSDDLAMQSRGKFYDYFSHSLSNNLLTVNDFSQGILKKNDVLFMNWQKLVSKKAEDRLLRRPQDERMQKEQGNYFEDIVQNTQSEGRNIILIIDESHEHLTESAFRDVVNPLDPRVIVKVSATPETIPNASDVQNNRAAYVEVKREDVVAAGLIKGQIVCQTDEDLKKHSGEDLDKVLIDLAVAKKKELDLQISTAGLNVNPLVLIQLPNDDNSVPVGIKNKELIVREYLKEKGIPDNKIACKFDGKLENMDTIAENDDGVDFMLFKLAAATGWDCPRAQILIMYREIISAQFHTQVLGRILRIPIVQKKYDKSFSEKIGKIFNTGYLYTNYKRNEVEIPEQEGKNKPKIYTAKNKYGKEVIIDQRLLSDFIPRTNNDGLGNPQEFQKSFIKSLDNYFSITSDDILPGKCLEKIKDKGIDINTRFTNKVIVNAKFENFDNIDIELKSKGSESEFEVSKNDVEKLFTSLCPQLLREQTEESIKIGNIAASWSPLKSALRVWMLKRLYPDADACYRVFIKDIQKDAASIFRRCITQALKDYRPLLNKQVKERIAKAAEQKSEVFTVQKEYAYTEDYEKISANYCVLEDAYFPKEHLGKKNELEFVNLLEQEGKAKKIEWWFKNGDEGKDYLAFKYFNSTDKKDELFYPDWIVKFKNGTIGIFDTKAGETAVSIETKDKAEELQKRLLKLNGKKSANSNVKENAVHYIGGIVVKANGTWRCNNKRTYNCNPNNLKGWIQLSDLLD